jgi:VIT1/CCC1 family predicted Fe2+/Mn2+ transporter
MSQMNAFQTVPARSFLPRAVRTTTAEAAAPGRHVQHHRKSNQLRDVILGGQAGLVNILGIVLGVIAGGGSQTVLLATGFAAAFTESISMGAVGYTSTIVDRDYYQAERKRERAEIDNLPAAERRELRTMQRKVSTGRYSTKSSTPSPPTASGGSEP